MSTPSLSQARRQYDLQQRLAVAAVVALRRLFKAGRPTVPQIAASAAGYQLASATLSSRIVAGYAGAQTAHTVASQFMGVSSRGFALTEPIIATIDRFAPAPAEALPAPWWDDAKVFMASLEQLIASEVQDAARSASQVEFVDRPDWQNYVRMLNPPSCARCAILAGRIYRDLEAFARHPLCDCVMVPVESWEAAHDAGLVSTPEMAFEKGQIGGFRTLEDGSKRFESGLSVADTRAISDGADITEVINAGHGTSSSRGHAPSVNAVLYGHQVKATTYGTTRRARWRKANPSRLVRLRPESIYEFAKDREDVLRLLRLYGYLTS